MTTKKRQKYTKSNLTWGKQNNPHPDKAFKGFRSYFPAVENFISTVTVAEYGKIVPDSIFNWSQNPAARWLRQGRVWLIG